WYTGQCPLLDGDAVILAPAGPDVLLMAVDGRTGAIRWRTPNPRGWKMTHSSLVPVEFGGKRQYVYVASGGVVGVSASEGALLWETDQWKISIAAIPTPVPVGNDRIFFSGGYNAGALMMRLKETNGKIVPEIVFRMKPTDFGATQQTPVLYNDHLYGVRPDGQLCCLDLDGKIRWTSGAGARFGLGPFVIGDGLIFALNDDGWLTLAEAAPSGYRQLARARVLDGHECWAPMALTHGRLLARSFTKMVCLDVKQ
ncbi:MAG: PQQ-binding-like beta-propeller repeat protein, partial [Verrucomicrobiae bacterium]|nr:PQQ-binding-like beta-propeller repeat protein [Verrucomicrobiae bacterium]